MLHLCSSVVSILLLWCEDNKLLNCRAKFAVGGRSESLNEPWCGTNLSQCNAYRSDNNKTPEEDNAAYLH